MGSVCSRTYICMYICIRETNRKLSRPWARPGHQVPTEYIGSGKKKNKEAEEEKKAQEKKTDDERQWTDRGVVHYVRAEPMHKKETGYQIKAIATACPIIPRDSKACNFYPSGPIFGGIYIHIFRCNGIMPTMQWNYILHLEFVSRGKKRKKEKLSQFS